jgi:hypothetical protein
MDGVSTVSTMTVEAGEDRLVSTQPCILTSVVMSDESGTESGMVVLCGVGGEGPYYRLRIPVGGVLTFTDRIALPWGLQVLGQAGFVNVSVGYQ